MKNVIFICTGNTCRSPMAEVIAKKFCPNTDISIISRGIYVPFSTSANEKAREAVKKYSICLNSHISKQITLDELKNASLVLTMENRHKELLKQNMKVKNLFTLYEFTTNEQRDITDPYGSNLENYINCLDEIYSLINKIDFNNI